MSKLLETGFDFGPELGALMVWLYPERHLEMNVFYDEQKCICQTWPDDLPIPTDEEIEAAYQTYLVEYPIQRLEDLRQSLRTEAEATFNKLASEKTGEPINALIIQEWKDKEVLALQWEADGKPSPDPAIYKMAYDESTGDPDKDAWQMVEAWLNNAKPWRLMYNGYVAWRQGFRAQIKAIQTEAELEALRAEIEPYLRKMMNLKT